MITQSEDVQDYIKSFKSGIDPLKQIDFVLDYIKKHATQFEILSTDKVVQHILDNKGIIGIDRIRFNQIIEKLEEDKYITVKGPDDKRYYDVTFKGVVFIGYRQSEDDRIKSDLQAKANQRAILWLTLIIAVGTSIAAAYYFFQMYDGATVAHPSAAIYILGLAVGVCILILVLVHR